MKKCAYCGKMFSIPKYANGKFRYDVKYCSEQCMVKVHQMKN